MISRASKSSILQGFAKSRSMLAGNAAYSPPVFESIATITSGSSTITFNSIPSTYKHLQIRILGRTTDTGSGGVDRFGMRFNGNSSSIYSTHYFAGSGSTASAGGNAADTAIRIYGALLGGGTTTSCFSAAIIDIHDYTSTTKNKTLKYFSAGDANGTGTVYGGSGLAELTSAVDSITLTIGSTGARTLATGSRIALYGIKG